MQAPPVQLLEGLSQDEYGEVMQWWNALSEDSRCEITGLWDSRLDSCAWTFEQDETGGFRFHPLPIILTNRFVPAFREIATEVWYADFFDYMFGRSEVYLWEPPPRTFYIGGSFQQSELVQLPGLLLCLSPPSPPQ
jgi:hypothetical protein